MSFDRKEFEALKEPDRQTRREYRQPDLQILQQAAVKAEHLTGHPSWDTFLTYIQAAAEQTEKQLAGFLGVLADPSVVGHERMLMAKIAAAECRARLELAKAIISLPKDIIEHGLKAKNTLMAENDQSPL